MQLRLSNVVPEFIEKNKIDGSGVWRQEISFPPHEITQIIAPSGKGKTSLIHMLYGLRKDYSGNIFYDSEEIKVLNAESFASYRRNQISIIFQDLRLFPNLTVRHNLEVKKQLNPFPGATSVEQMAESLGIADKLDKPAGNCSFGEQQRIAIIRALQQPFDYLLMDEPFSHLDDKNRLKATDLILAEVRKRKAATVVADLKKLDFFPANNHLDL